jgi:hypothetical protein
MYNSLLINVRTEFIRLIVFALTLALSLPPKEGSFWEALPQPTVGVSWFGLSGWWGCFSFGRNVLRARKRSSERTAMAFMRRTETG